MDYRILLLLGAPLIIQDDPAKEILEFVNGLRSDNAELRERSGQKLLELGTKSRPALQEAAKDKDAEVSSRARHLLKVLDYSEQFSPHLKNLMPNILQRLASGDAATWLEVYLALESRTPERKEIEREVGQDLDLLSGMALSGARSPEVKVRLLQSFSKWRIASRSSDLLPFLSSEDSSLRAAAAQALIDLEAVGQIPQVAVLATENNTTTRMIAVRILRRLGKKIAVAELVRRLSDPTARVRAFAAEAVGMLGTNEDELPLRKMLVDKDWRVRKGAVIALGQLECNDSVPSILPLLSDTQEPVRIAAANSLKELRATNAVTEIEKLLNDTSPRVRSGAIIVLCNLHGAGALEKVRPLLEEDDPLVRGSACLAMAQLKGKDASPLLIQHLNDRDEWVRFSVAKALGALEAREARIPLIALLKDPALLVSSTAAQSLCRLGAKEGVPPVLTRSIDMNYLNAINAIRSPKLWDRLSQGVLPNDVKGTPEDTARAIALAAGLALEWPKVPFLNSNEWGSAFEPQVIRGHAQKSLLAALDETSCFYVLEEGKIRILWWDEAHHFWQEWWSNQ